MAVSGRLAGFSVVGRAIGRAEPRSNLTLEFATDRNETVVVENDDQPMPAGSDETPHLGGVHRDVSANLNEAESGKPLENAHERTADLDPRSVLLPGPHSRSLRVTTRMTPASQRQPRPKRIRDSNGRRKDTSSVAADVIVRRAVSSPE
jgi:hypothetical protein